MYIDKILGMNFHSLNKSTAIKLLKLDIDTDIKHQHISITNTEAIYFGSKNLEHYNYINNSKFSLCDGIGVKIGGFFKGKKIIRYNGPKIFNDIIDEGQNFDWTHYFYGGVPEVVEDLKIKCLKKFPKSKIVGVYSPPFRKLNNQEKNDILNDINKCNPNFIWVGLGLPKQENWIMDNINKINVNFAIGVGAVFDTQTGNIKRAPIFLQRIGLEWLYRVMAEPRMIPRLKKSFVIMFKIIFSKKK